MKKISYQYERKDSRGVFREYLNSDRGWKAVNQGVMKKNALMGNHYHKRAISAFFVLSGSADFFYKDIRKVGRKSRLVLKEGEGVLILPYETHTVRFRERSVFLLLKTEKFDPKNKDLYEAKLL